MISLLISLLIFAAVIYIILIILNMIVPAPFLTVARLIVGLIVLIVLLQWLGLFSGHPIWLR